MYVCMYVHTCIYLVDFPIPIAIEFGGFFPARPPAIGTSSNSSSSTTRP